MNTVKKIEELASRHGDNLLVCMCADQTHIEYCYATEKSGEVRYIVCDYITELEVDGVKLNVITKNAIIERINSVIIVHGV